MCVNMYGGVNLGLLIDYSSTSFFCSRICLVQNSLVQLVLLTSFFRNLESCAFGFWTPCLNCKCFSHGANHLPSPEVPLKAHYNWGMMKVTEIVAQGRTPNCSCDTSGQPQDHMLTGNITQTGQVIVMCLGIHTHTTHTRARNN